MKLKFLGHSSFLIEHEETKILIDPFIEGNESARYNKEDIEGITHILVSHGHGDHIGDTEKIGKNNHALVICNFEIGQYFANRGVKVHTMHVGGRYQFPFGRVKMTPAVHGSGIFNGEFFICGGAPCGFLLEIGNHKIYHAGDTGLTMDMKLLAYDKIDFALLPIGGNYTMDVEDAMRAVEFIKPRVVIPMHYDTFPLIEADPTELCKGLENCQVHILNPGEGLEVK